MIVLVKVLIVEMNYDLCNWGMGRGKGRREKEGEMRKREWKGRGGGERLERNRGVGGG